MNFIIYYGLGLAYVTGVILLNFDYSEIKSLDKVEMIGAIIATLLLPLVWPITIVIVIVRTLYYIIKNKKG